jgi:hypothetical protein
MSGELCRHLVDNDVLARNSFFRLIKEIAKRQGIDEALKAKDPMAWVGAMNMIQAQAEETVLAEYVYR